MMPLAELLSELEEEEQLVDVIGEEPRIVRLSNSRNCQISKFYP